MPTWSKGGATNGNNGPSLSSAELQMTLSKRSRLVDVNTKQVNKRLRNVLDQKLQVLDTLKEEQRRSYERDMTQLVIKTARYYYRLEELQTAQLESDKINGKRKIKLQSKKMTIDQQTQAPVNKLPPISDKHSISKAAQFRLQVKKEKTTMMRLPPI